MKTAKEWIDMAEARCNDNLLCGCGMSACAAEIQMVAAIRSEAFETAAKAVDYSLCDVAEDCDLFMAHRDFFAAAIRALATKEPA